MYSYLLALVGAARCRHVPRCARASGPAGAPHRHFAISHSRVSRSSCNHSSDLRHLGTSAFSASRFTAASNGGGTNTRASSMLDRDREFVRSLTGDVLTVR
jgi:hypothetical protein